MVSFIPMNVNKFRIPNTKHFVTGGKCETFKGVNVVVQWFPTGEEFLPREEFHEFRGGISTL